MISDKFMGSIPVRLKRIIIGVKLSKFIKEGGLFRKDVESKIEVYIWYTYRVN